MKRYNKSYLKIIFIFVISIFIAFNVQAEEESINKTENINSNSLKEVTITKVIDGDTVKTKRGVTIRLIGIDTPEINWDTGAADFYGYKALKFSNKHLLNEKVYLEYDKDKKDDYGRQLAYIYLQNGELFNLKLLEKGYAHLLIVEPNNKYQEKFKKIAKKTREEKIGIWRKVDQLSDRLETISWKDAKKYYGKNVIVSGKIVNTYKSEEVTFLNFSKNYSETLTIVIFNDDLNKFAVEANKYFNDKKVKAVGRIKKYDSAPEIIITDPTSIILDE
ncbi:MAG: thermonuclease family protein [Bacillota bacterium]